MPPTPSDNELAHAVTALQRGDIVCIPTETSYGLAVDALSLPALERLSAVKGRPDSSPFGLIAADLQQVRALSRIWPDIAQKLASAHWPGPLTLVVPAASHLPGAIVGPTGGVGIRVSSHPVPVALARALGRPVTATSANPRGLPPAADIDTARAYFGDRVACYFDDGPSPGERPSTVAAIDDNDQVRVLRAGPVDVS